MATTVTRQQYFTAVSQLGNMDTLYQALTMNTNDPAWIEFYAGSSVTYGDPLSNLTQAAFGWNSAQMAALFAAAGSSPSPTPDPGPTYLDPTFGQTYQGLCAAVADTLNRADLLFAIPNFTVLASARLSRDMARVKHPSAIVRAQASSDKGYVTLPEDYVAMYQLMEQDTSKIIDYLSPDQTKTVLSQGWDTSLPRAAIYPQLAPASGGAPTYYTIIGKQIRVFPVATGVNLDYDLWYYAQLPAISASNPTNWALSRYPDLYLYGTLVHSAPYLKADERVEVWEGAYQKILSDIEVEADRAVRSQSKLVAARKSF